ncbi:MAG: hypothetical protein JNM09_22180 [Blastocatellia bacterium]|nr:hypothetical protein [Blastocatellia bacterium]
MLQEHLSVCLDCRQAQAVLERENELFAQYYEQSAVEPSDELWQAIHDQIKPELAAAKARQSGWTTNLRNWFAPFLSPTMLRQIGFAVLLVIVSVGVTALYFSSRKVEQNVVETKPTPTAMETPARVLPTPTLKSDENVKPQVAVVKTPAPKVVIKPSAPNKLTEDELLSQQIARASREYQSAIHLLERTIAKRKTQLDEGTVKQFEGSLAMIDASIASSRAALRSHPNDPTAARFLLAAYSKKVELMQEIAMR